MTFTDASRDIIYSSPLPGDAVLATVLRIILSQTSPNLAFGAEADYVHPLRRPLLPKNRRFMWAVRDLGNYYFAGFQTGAQSCQRQISSVSRKLGRHVEKW